MYVYVCMYMYIYTVSKAHRIRPCVHFQPDTSIIQCIGYPPSCVRQLGQLLGDRRSMGVAATVKRDIFIPLYLRKQERTNDTLPAFEPGAPPHAQNR